MEDQNPYTLMKGYKLEDASGIEVGEIEDTVYDAPSDVLKYIIVNGRPILADRIEVDTGEERVRVPYGREAIESAPTLEDPSGEFDRTLRAHYEERG
jgi:sporulation protein YlmC with PRC-barrel domain